MEGFFALPVWGDYSWRGFYMEPWLILGILWYSIFQFPIFCNNRIHITTYKSKGKNVALTCTKLAKERVLKEWHIK